MGCGAAAPIRMGTPMVPIPRFTYNCPPGLSNHPETYGVTRRLEPKGDGEISMILILEDGATEVEVRLPGKFKVSPQICGAIKAVPGVVDVQAL